MRLREQPLRGREMAEWIRTLPLLSCCCCEETAGPRKEGEMTCLRT